MKHRNRREEVRQRRLAVVQQLLAARPRPNPALLKWHDGVVRRLAQAIYEEKAFDRLPVLADALEEAGWDDEEMLLHCRDQANPHSHGCWILGWILGKE